MPDKVAEKEVEVTDANTGSDSTGGEGSRMMRHPVTARSSSSDSGSEEKDDSDGSEEGGLTQEVAEESPPKKKSKRVSTMIPLGAPKGDGDLRDKYK